VSTHVVTGTVSTVPLIVTVAGRAACTAAAFAYVGAAIVPPFRSAIASKPVIMERERQAEPDISSELKKIYNFPNGVEKVTKSSKDRITK
jgi:hypothetical protein